MADEPENLTLALLRDLRADIAEGFQDVTEAFERVYVELAEVKGEVVKCRADVAGADLASNRVTPFEEWMETAKMVMHRDRDALAKL